MFGRLGWLNTLAMLVLMWASAMSQSSWQVAHRVQLGAEHDNNIYEAARRTDAFSGRLLLRSRVDRQWQRANFALTYSGGLQTYPGHADENKLTNDLGVELGWQLKPWCRVNGAAQGTLKVYFNGPYDFGTTQSSLNVALQLPQEVVATLSATTLRLDYAESDDFDYLGRAFGISFRRRFTDWLMLDAGAHHIRLRYLRPAFDVSDNQLWLPLGGDQRDQQTSAMLRCILGRQFLINLSGEWLRNNSNSDGHEYDRLRISLIAAFRLSPRWLLRVAALRQHKNYLDALPPALPIELDAERNESNFIVADVSYDLSNELAWLTRVSIYDNEGAVRGLFYQKTLFFSGFEYRF